MKLVGVLLILSAAAVCAAHKHKPEWEDRNEAERMNSRGCANLTLVLDNWKYAIMTQVKDLLLHDHNAVLPDYGRIQPLSDALGDLYKEFNALKEHLTELTAKFGDAEAFVDDVRLGRIPTPLRGEHQPIGSASEAGRDSGSRPAAPRSRVIIRKIKKLSGSQH